MTKSGKEKMEKDKTKNGMESAEIPITDSEEVNIDETDKVSQLEKQVSELNDRFLRSAAEFDNYKKRTDAEKSDFFAYANEKLILDLLPVLDDFERALKSYNEKHNAESFKKGVQLVYEKFKKTLEKLGLKEIKSTGKEFDVNLHEAIMQQPDAKAAPNTILDTAEKGYHLKDKVIRHSKVVVSTKPE